MILRIEKVNQICLIYVFVLALLFQIRKLSDKTSNHANILHPAVVMLSVFRI